MPENQHNPDIAAQLAIVLVEPQGPLNIGSVCRAMGNFGFSDLRLVNPQTDHLRQEARQMAVKAGYILESATIYSSLEEALHGCQYAFGTTRRFGRYRDRDDFLYPDAAAQMIAGFDHDTHTALVFGREDCGLLNEELDLCQRFLTIPTCDAMPSMNLAQSVSLCLYEVSKQGLEARGELLKPNLAEIDQTESMLQHMKETLTRIDYLDPQNPDHILRSFRRLFGKNGLTDRDVRILRGLWSRIDRVQLELEKRIKSDGENQ
ncbi:RNA methyltransferase [Desulfuromonas acetoxidans]|uniref:RNA methyltransferase n=1 Tax=Desulfuromonas acetoxidans TaxID=891 RepID=UPI002931EAB4|nr:RNA methyltransferase [Desulfuromonas acetoxidans]